jgi:hypothetical protein
MEDSSDSSGDRLGLAGASGLDEYLQSLPPTGDWTVANYKTILNRINSANLQLLLLDHGMRYYTTRIHRITMILLIISSISSTLAVSQVTRESSDAGGNRSHAPETIILLQVIMMILSIGTTILTGYLKISRMSEWLEEARVLNNKFMQFVQRIADELQRPHTIRRNATLLIHETERPLNHLMILANKLAIPPEVQATVSKLLQNDDMRRLKYLSLLEQKKRAMMADVTRGSSNLATITTGTPMPSTPSSDDNDSDYVFNSDIHLQQLSASYPRGVTLATSTSPRSMFARQPTSDIIATQSNILHRSRDIVTTTSTFQPVTTAASIVSARRDTSTPLMSANTQPAAIADPPLCATPATSRKHVIAGLGGSRLKEARKEYIYSTDQLHVYFRIKDIIMDELNMMQSICRASGVIGPLDEVIYDYKPKYITIDVNCRSGTPAVTIPPPVMHLQPPPCHHYHHQPIPSPQSPVLDMDDCTIRI